MNVVNDMLLYLLMYIDKFNHTNHMMSVVETHVSIAPTYKLRKTPSQCTS
jgi:hypothetical protein